MADPFPDMPTTKLGVGGGKEMGVDSRGGFGFFLRFCLLFMYLFYLLWAALDLSCGTWDLSLQCTGSSLWCSGFSLVVVLRLRSTCAL